MKHGRLIQHTLDAFAFNNNIKSIGEIRAQQIVYETLTEQRLRQKGDWGKIPINISALDFRYRYESPDPPEPLNLYTYVLFCGCYVPHYCDWVVGKEEYYYDIQNDMTYYWSPSAQCYNICAGMMKGVNYKEKDNEFYIMSL